MSGETTALLVLVSGLLGYLVKYAIDRAGRKDALRLAAVERRLAAHQQAFALWCQLLRDLHSDRAHDTAVKCQRWWEENCLYLDSKSRQEFRDRSLDVAMWRDLKGIDDQRERFAQIRKVLTLLVEGVGLPPVGDHEWAERTFEKEA